MFEEISVAWPSVSAWPWRSEWLLRIRNPLTSRPSSPASACSGNVVSGVIAPEPRPAIAVTILNTEPGT